MSASRTKKAPRRVAVPKEVAVLRVSEIGNEVAVDLEVAEGWSEEAVLDLLEGYLEEMGDRPQSPGWGRL